MSLNKKKLFISILLICVQILLAACFPLGGDDVEDYLSDIGEIGEPQLSCIGRGEIKLSYPISAVVSAGHENSPAIYIFPTLRVSSSIEWTSDTVSWILNAPETPTEIYINLVIHWKVVSGYDNWGRPEKLSGSVERIDTITLPTCEYEAASPPEEEVSISDGTPVIQSAKCTFNDRGAILQVDVHFPQSTGGFHLSGLVSSYEALMNGITISPFPSESHTLRFVIGLPEEGPVNFVLRSLSSHVVVMVTTINEWKECNEPDGIPVVLNSTCVGKGTLKQLMIVLEFEPDVAGEYMALVENIPYELAPVADHPNRLYYFGTPPPQGTITIQLLSLPDQEIAFVDRYVPVVCGPQEKKEDDDGGYTPPSY